MGNDLKDFLAQLQEKLKSIDYVKTEDIPNIGLYMDQVTTFMDEQLEACKRYDDDKILTKTMINNYAKNDLLPPPVKKKYSKEHVLMLIFIYYFKGILSINDIQTLLEPVSRKYFQTDGNIDVSRIYDEVFSLEKSQVEVLKEDILHKFETAQGIFGDAPEEDREFLRMFSFVGLLGFDVYIKKLLIEKMVDELRKSGEQEKGK